MVPSPKDSEEVFKLSYIGGGLLNTAELSLNEASKEIIHFGEICAKGFRYVKQAINEHDESKINGFIDKLVKYEEITDNIEYEIANYLNDSHKTRKYTLDILAQYIGFSNFDKFVSWLKTSTKYNSSFFNACQMTSSELHPGDFIEIGWSPNRLVTLEYLGDSTFEVKISSNSK